MKWQKKGLIYCPEDENEWAKHTFLTPTPFKVSDGEIRLYGGFRDNKGVSRIGYIDVQESNPKEVLKVSKNPVLDIGKKGCFDDNGMILGDLIRVGEEIYMYYVGFQIVSKVKFLAYSGLAISQDNGESFKRYSQIPIMDRAQNAHYIRAIHTVIYDQESNKFKIWYSVGSDWYSYKDVDYPCYHIRYTESNDGINFTDSIGKECILPAMSEYRIGRPRVIKRLNEKYEMRYTFDTKDKQYKTGYAESEDGIKWVRMDEKTGIEKSESGWDSGMVCYPVEYQSKEKRYLFYSGNNMGETGVGYAESAN
jgi:predicted GH43/DUF377 family glycosyl hydrolase